MYSINWSCQCTNSSHSLAHISYTIHSIYVQLTCLTISFRKSFFRSVYIYIYLRTFNQDLWNVLLFLWWQARSSASIPRGIVPTSRRCRITAMSPISHPTAPGHTAPPTQLLWPTGFLCGWPVGLQFTPDSLRNPVIGRNSFRQSLKTFLFAMYWCIQRIRGFTMMQFINWLFTYLLTYLPQTCSTLMLHHTAYSIVNWSSDVRKPYIQRNEQRSLTQQ